MIRILIADDHAIVRGGLRQIIAITSDIIVAAEAARGGEGVERLRSFPVDLLLGMMMPGISGVDLIRRVRPEQPSLPVLVLSINDEAQVPLRALRAGATGYLTRDSDPDVLLAAIRKLADGGRFIDLKLVDAMVFDAHRGDVPPNEVLSDREFQCCRCWRRAGASVISPMHMRSARKRSVPTRCG
jgi:DNA-binding NarL/FixJ family response regulator